MTTKLTTSEPIDEDAKVRATARDYVEAWFTADAERMERALHPDLAKRAYLPGLDGKVQLSQTSAMALVQFTRQSKGLLQQSDVKILDRFEGIASVRTTTPDWVDHLHLVRVGGDWKIINILWELTPERWIARGGRPGERTR
jgi:hypothetical protein